MVLNITPPGLIVLLVLTYPVVIGVFIWRVWILWELSGTRAFWFTTVNHFVFTLLVVISLGFITEFSALEFRARGRYASDDKSIFEHIFTIPISKWLFAISLMYTTFIWALKGAFLGYFHEFHRHLNNRLRQYLYLVTTFVATSYFVMIILQFTLCLPLHRNWSLGADRCQVSEGTVGAAVQVSTNVFSDLLLISIPVFTVRGLKLPSSEKYAITAIVLVGSIVPLIAVIRFTIVWELAHNEQTGPNQLRTNIAMAAVEALIADVTFFLPVLRVFYRKMKYNETIPVENLALTGINISKTIEVRYDRRRMNNSEAELTSWQPEWDQEAAAARAAT